MIDRESWQVPATYSEPEREANSARSGLGLLDDSAVNKLSLRGPGVVALAQQLTGNGETLSPCHFGEWCDGPATAYLLTTDHLLIVGRAGFRPHAILDQATRFSVLVTDVTGGLAGFVLVGPRIDATLGQLTQLDLRPSVFPPGCCRESALAGVEALLARPAAAAIPSFRVFVGWDVAEYVWERILGTAPPGEIALLGCHAAHALGIA